MIKFVFIVFTILYLCFVTGCTQHKVEVAPVEVKPIHITIDVNVKVDRALDNFFGDIDTAEEELDTRTTTN
jgi:hypothetical protein